jgi:hypothetical protein
MTGFTRRVLLLSESSARIIEMVGDDYSEYLEVREPEPRVPPGLTLWMRFQVGIRTRVYRRLDPNTYQEVMRNPPDDLDESAS